MAGLQSKFLNGAELEIQIVDPDYGTFTLAYAQAVSFSHNMRNAPIGGIGSYGQHTLEPLQYSAQGSLVITRYSEAAKTKATNAHLPANLRGSTNSKWASGNGLLHRSHFNPVRLLISKTFDIVVHTHTVAIPTFKEDGNTSKEVKEADAKAIADAVKKYNESRVYELYDCRMTNFSFNLTTGALLNETVSFVCRGVKDYTLGLDSESIKSVPVN